MQQELGAAKGDDRRFPVARAPQSLALC